MDRIAQTQGGTTEYFLGDALGSVRQMANNSGQVTYGRTYDPYGVVINTAGTAQTAYGYTGEYSGDYNELLYLRARYYAPGTGRFLTKDTWDGDAMMPMSFNHWNYVDSNPINRVDPTGLCWIKEGGTNVWIPEDPTGTTACINDTAVTIPSPSYFGSYNLAGCGPINVTSRPGGLDENDINILSTIIALESSNGQVPDYVNYMKAVTLLNLRSFNQSHGKYLKPLDDWKYHERALFDGQTPPINGSFENQYNRLLERYRAYSSKGKEATGLSIAEFHIIEAQVKRAVRTWARYGSRSSYDIVHGATSFTDSDNLCFPHGACQGKSKWFSLTQNYKNNRVNKDVIQNWRDTYFTAEITKGRGLSSSLYSVTSDVVDGEWKPVWTFTYFSSQPWPEP